MGCGISVFDCRTQRNAANIEDYEGIPRKQSPNGGLMASPRSTVLLGSARKCTFCEKRLAKVEPCNNLSNTVNETTHEYLIPAIQHKMEVEDGHCSATTTTNPDMNVGEILEIKTVEAMNEPKCFSKAEDSMIIIYNNSDDYDHELAEEGARIPDYDGPLWIASPSFREYCIPDSHSEDSLKGTPTAGNYGRENMDNKIQMPRDDQHTCNDRRVSSAPPVKTGRLTLRKVLTMHNKHKPKSVLSKFVT